MPTEIRDFGDNKTIVVYTDNRQLANRIEGWNKCYKVIDYKQNDRLVGLDLYLPKRLRGRVERSVSQIGQSH